MKTHTIVTEFCVYDVKGLNYAIMMRQDAVVLYVGNPAMRHENAIAEIQTDNPHGMAVNLVRGLNTEDVLSISNKELADEIRNIKRR